MDSEILVEAQKEDGLALINKLVADKFDVTVAFWAKLSDGHLWYFYIGTKSLDFMDGAKAWHTLYASMQQLDYCSILLSEIRLISANDPIAVAAVEARSLHDGLEVIYRKPHLASLEIEEAYIYSTTAGLLARALVAHQVAGLMAGMAEDKASTFSLRDGSRIQGVPVSLRRTTAGGLDIVLHDVGSNLDRSISADEVIAIEINRFPRLLGLLRR